MWREKWQERWRKKSGAKRHPTKRWVPGVVEQCIGRVVRFMKQPLMVVVLVVAYTLILYRFFAL